MVEKKLIAISGQRELSSIIKIWKSVYNKKSTLPKFTSKECYKRSDNNKKKIEIKKYTFRSHLVKNVHYLFKLFINGGIVIQKN